MDTYDNSQANSLLIPVPKKYGGLELDLKEQVIYYLNQAVKNVASTFLLSQRNGAVAWIFRSNNEEFIQSVSDSLKNEFFCTQAVSQIKAGVVSSRINVINCQGKLVINGTYRWVTGASLAKIIVVGTLLDDGNKTVFIIKTEDPGVTIRRYNNLAALNDSKTCEVIFKDVEVHQNNILLHPDFPLKTMTSVRLDGYPALHSSAIALGFSRRVISEVEKVFQGNGSGERLQILDNFKNQFTALEVSLVRLAENAYVSDIPYQELRAQANMLAVNSADLFALALKGSSFLNDSEANRFVTEAQFFSGVGNVCRDNHQDHETFDRQVVKYEMARNIEIKAKNIDPEKALMTARDLSGTEGIIIDQEDIFYNSTSGRLKLRVLSASRGELISYDRSDESGPRVSCYSIFKTSDPFALDTVLSNSIGRRAIVKKIRILFLAGRTRIHLDQVENLGSFIELEVVLDENESLDAGQHEAKMLMKHFDIDPSALIGCAYVDML